MTTPARRTQTLPPPTLLSVPTASDPNGAYSRLDALWSTWTMLSAHGGRRFAQESWRSLGLGAVHVADPAFEALAGQQARAWATLDARDDWGQTILEIARRQRAWFQPPSRCVLDALAHAKLTLYEVSPHRAPTLVLRRVRDGSLHQVHARFDKGAFPCGRLIASRLVSVGDLNVTLCSTVVPRPACVRPARREMTKHDPVVQMVFDDARATIDEARSDVKEPVWLDLGPCAMRRLVSAVDTLHRAMNRGPGTSRFVYQGCEGRTVRVRRDAGRMRITVRTSGDSNLAMRWSAASEASVLDRAVAIQAGLERHPHGVLQLEELSRAKHVSSERCEEAARALFAAALDRARGGLDRVA